MRRVPFILAAIGLLTAGWAASTQSHVREEPTTPEDLVFEPVFVPARLVGLHDYEHPTTRAVEIPVSVAPTPDASSRPHVVRRPPSWLKAVRVRRAAHNLAGKASWYATGRSGAFAAACRPLRQAMGRHWRGSQVIVAYGKRALIVTLNDWCGSHDKTIDLSDEAFGYLSRGHLSRGVLRVSVGW